jgi:hypothetical protein
VAYAFNTVANWQCAQIIGNAPKLELLLLFFF